MLKPGWLKEILEEAKENVEKWPKWMRQSREELDAERERNLKALDGELRSLGRDPDNPLSIHQ